MVKKKSLYALSFYFAVALLFFFPIFFMERTFVPADVLDQDFLYPPREKKLLSLQRWDSIMYAYPTDALFNREIKRGRIPLWNPYVFSGYPVFASGQNGFLNPFNIVLNFIFTPWKAKDIFLFIHLILSGIFTFLFLMEIGLSFYPALFGGLVWSYSGLNAGFFSQGSTISVAPYLPLLLLSYEKGIKGKSLMWTGVGALSASMLFLGRHLNVSVFAFVGFILYALYRISIEVTGGNLNLKRAVLPFILITLLGVGISAVQLLPTLELSKLAELQRPPESFPMTSVQGFIEFLSITFFHPFFLGGEPAYEGAWVRIYQVNGFAGIITILLAFFLPFASHRRKWEGSFYLAVSLLFILASSLTPITTLFEWIPSFRRLNPFKLLYPADFFMTMAGAIGFESLIEEDRTLRKLLGLVAGTTFVLIVGGITLIYEAPFLSYRIKSLTNPGIFSVILSLFVAGILFLEESKKIKGPGILALSIFEIVPFAFIINMPVKTSLLKMDNNYMNELKRIAGYERVAGIEPNLSSLLQLYSPEGYESLIPDNYFIALKGKPPEDILLREPKKRMIRLEDISYEMAKLLGVRYIIGTDRVYKIPDDKLEELNYSVKGVKIYKVKGVLPRAFVISSWKKVKSWEDAISLLKNGYNPEDGVLLEEDIGECRGGGGTAEIVEYDLHRVVIRTTSYGCGILVFSDTWYPGWKVYVNGREERVLRAYGFLRSVLLKDGENFVEFQFKPKSIFYGLILSFLSLIISFSMVFGGLYGKGKI